MRKRAVSARNTVINPEFDDSGNNFISLFIIIGKNKIGYMLFNLQNDPFELKNLYRGEISDDVKRLVEDRTDSEE